MRKYALYFVLLFALFPQLCFAEDNLLDNPGFENDQLGYLAMWDVDSYIDTDAARRVYVIEDPVHSGSRSLAIVNFVPNDTKVVQWLKVDPNTLYKISVWAMAEVLDREGIGANLSALGSITASRDVRETKGNWELIELVGKTGENQRYLAVAVRLGFYNNLITGRAYFDDIRLEKLSAPPAETSIVDFGSNRGTGFVVYKAEDGQAEGQQQIPLILIVAPLAAAGLAAFFLFLLLVTGRIKTVRRFPFIKWSGRGKAKGKEAVTVKDTITELRSSSRKQMKINIAVKKTYHSGGYKLVELKSTNISETGIFLHSEDLSLFSIDEQLELTATYKRGKYDLGEAQVVRKQETFKSTGKRIRPGFGLTFTETTQAQLKNIKALLE